ncbi:hypothetical protein TRICI_002892 [Trichomonascus ciferrii]|uniref:Oxidase FUB9 n=1 Tax=Trichomonascus ciferrii TaxID=44093 RepID=A0A642V5E0_9ASCO|nr:hypothetical protein TRICI_002892 [Trichomonascus ciferrii]
MKVITSLKDLEEASKTSARMYEGFWNGGADEMITVRENEDCFNHYRIRGRGFHDVSKLDTTSKSLFGTRFKVPIGIGPSAQHDLASPEGELATARACENKGWPLALSSFSGKSAEEVIEAGPTASVFFQLYVFKNRATTEALVRRVERAGYKALLVTIDTPYAGKRVLDIHNQFSLPDHLERGNFKGVNLANPVEQNERASSQNALDPSLNWHDTIPWLRSITNMEIWVKGVLTAEDASMAVVAGVDGIWVSNHGGRQMDSGVPTIEALPEVVAAVNGRVPVHIDGGVRRGGDVFKALALGADFVWLARPALWGLHYNGQKGVEIMQDIITKEFELIMAFTGTTTVDQINESYLLRVWPKPQRVYKL